MFSGIIQATGEVVSAQSKDTSLIVRIQKPSHWRLKLGASIAVNGVCSTARALGATYFEVEYMPETLHKSMAAGLAKGDVVNLERSLRMSDVVDGHVVQGHVDFVGKVTAVLHAGASHEITIAIPKAAMRLIAPQGSVAVNGISLTVASVKERTFTVALVSHTIKHTNIGRVAKGGHVNIETDMIARYLARLAPR